MGKLRLIVVGMGLVLLLSQLFSCAPKSAKQEETPVLDTVVEVKVPVLKYGFPIDSFALEMGKVKNNEYLSQILNARGVSMGTIDKIARKSKTVFDVRKIKSGENFCILSTRDSVPVAKYFVYENSAAEYTVFELTDTLGIYKGQKEVKTRLRTAQGVVESSLWNAMVDNEQDPMLALELSDIFAWTIDFFAIQKGDRFRVIYDEQFVDSVSIGIGEIYAVQFDHYGDKNYAFIFDQDDRFDYFDEQGKSLRKAFLKAPLQFSRVSSRFSNSRMHPVLRIRRPHHGVDYAARKGTPVVSIGDGTVIARAYQARGGGNYVKIKHNSVYTTTYMHLSGFGKGITTGARVKQGDVIGYVGATGLATGPHLDFRVAKNGSYVDPLKVKAPPVEPVKEENMARYTAVKDSLMLELQKIQWEPVLELADSE
ncbi:M23 family metallopeptidase [Draconibacterium halophilum]|uniref:Peptidoglycan DD-metalloendopeptidase family protein n=1 Tax=Draconibacterium halophilum TaxID=2706887 RepID=A0A6C0RHJ6_9BACT|nr:peptidoglycan DD-metalloendopeptidase family protein [Draconibacterium halophilum]QIA09476.1 peptidoglycan DD-metalloendopeptidase family protein [Draconibacterium halophilum]